MFQRKIDELFHGLPNVFGIAYDVMTSGFDDVGGDHNEKVDKVLKYGEKPTCNSRKTSFISDAPALPSLGKSYQTV